MNSINGEEFIEASRKAQLIFVGFIVLLVAVYAPLKLKIDSIRTPENASLEEINRVIETYKKFNNILLIVTVLQSVLFSGYFIRMANKSIKSGKFPPPGTSVLRRTKIVRGKKALFSASATYFLALLIWFPVILPVYLKWFLE